MNVRSELIIIITLLAFFYFTANLVGYYFVINTYLIYKNLIISALIWVLSNAHNIFSLPLPFILKKIKDVRINVIIFSVLASLVLFILARESAPLEEILLISIFNFLIIIPIRILGYYARTLLNKYTEFINYNSILNIFLLSSSLLAVITSGILNEYSSSFYLLLIVLPLQITTILLVIILDNIKITISSVNSFKVWINYMKSNLIFRFLETRLYPVMAIASGLSILFIRLLYVNNATFPEYYTTVVVVNFLAQVVGSSISLKSKTESMRKLLLLLFPVILFEFVFPFIPGEVVPIAILTFIQSTVAAYVVVHINSIYQYITNKDDYVNISITQNLLQQISRSITVILVSIIATAIGITFTYIGMASLLTAIVLHTIFSETIKKIKIEKK